MKTRISRLDVTERNYNLSFRKSHLTIEKQQKKHLISKLEKNYRTLTQTIKTLQRYGSRLGKTFWERKNL